MDAPPPYPASEKYPGGGPPVSQPGYPGAYPPPGGAYPPPGHYPATSQPQGYGQPMQPGYGPPVSTTTTTIIATQPTLVAAVPLVFHEYPVSMTCPSCRAQVVTSVQYEVGTFAWLLFFLMCVFGLWICCFLPFCIDGCRDAIHHCPNCHAQVGVFRRM